MYGFTARSVLDLYGAYMKGAPGCVVLVISAHALSEKAQDALMKSADRLGFGSQGCAWVSLASREDALTVGQGHGKGVVGARIDEDGEGDEGQTIPSENGNPLLGPRDMNIIFEGIDPVCAIVTDRAAADVLSRGYGASLPREGLGRIACRDVVVLDGFEKMLEEDTSKQRAWSLLKKLH